MLSRWRQMGIFTKRQAAKVATVRDMEIWFYNLCYSGSAESVFPVENQFYKTLAGEEREHHLALLDSYEYLSDPTGWFTKKAHWSFDGA